MHGLKCCTAQLSKDEAWSMIDTMGLTVSRDYMNGAWSVYDVNSDDELGPDEFARFFTVSRQAARNAPLSSRLSPSITLLAHALQILLANAIHRCYCKYMLRSKGTESSGEKR